MTDTNTTLPTELTEEENKNIVILPILTPITEENTDTDDDSLPDLIPCSDDEIDDSMPKLEYCNGCSMCSNFGIEYKDIQTEQPTDYSDEEIEKREERYENWKENKRINYPRNISPLFEEKR
jgi:hypothetical protein